jgi:hypothetical protein
MASVLLFYSEITPQEHPLTSRSYCQEPDPLKGMDLQRWGGICPSSLEAHLTRLSLGCFGSYRAMLEANR